MLQWFYMRNTAVVCVEKPVEGGYGKIYWNTGFGFNEVQSRVVHSRNYFDREGCIILEESNGLVAIRSDPLRREGAFQFTALTLRWPGSILFQVGRLYGENRHVLKLSPGQAIQTNQIVVGRDSYRSTGIDPHFVWQVNRQVRTKRWIVHGLTDFSVYLVILGALILVRRDRSEPIARTNSELRKSALWAVYPLFLGWSALVGDSAVELGQWLIPVILIFHIMWDSKYFESLSARVCPHEFIMLLVVSVAVTFDLWGHIAWSGQPLMSSKAGIQYNWSLDRTMSENLRNATVAYRDDIAKMRGSLDPGAMFLSDRATNYYLGAYLPIYGVNPNPHHQLYYNEGYSPFIDSGFVWSLCDSDNVSRLGDLITKKNETLKRFQWRPLKYIIFNTDDINRNVRGNCLTRNMKAIVAAIGDKMNLIYKGKYLIVYELQE